MIPGILSKRIGPHQLQPSLFAPGDWGIGSGYLDHQGAYGSLPVIEGPLLDLWDGTKYVNLGENNLPSNLDLENYNPPTKALLFVLPSPATVTSLQISRVSEYDSVGLMAWDENGLSLEFLYESATTSGDVSTWGVWPRYISAFGILGWGGYPQGIPSIVSGIQISFS